jgi:hypothetical protein
MIILSNRKKNKTLHLFEFKSICNIQFLLLIFLLAFQQLHAQSCRDASVEVSAVIQPTPPQISLNWLASTSATQYQVYRKLKTDNAWVSQVAALGGTATTFIDQNVVAGVEYEYRVMKSASNHTGYGYICAGINIPAREQRGKLLLIIDSTFVISCSAKIARLREDLAGDGWKVLTHYVSRLASVVSVKSLIVSDYYQDPANTRAVFLLGHVPVPYSGNLNPDGHSDHQGAWPADVFYGDIDGNWTDYAINNNTASDPRNRNIPGDGKYDQSYIPSDIELQGGRVDFANMPAFAQTETQLIQNYLDKDHDYRHKAFTVTRRGVVDDNFGYFSGEAFAASGWKNFGPLVGNTQSVAGDYIISMTGNSALWSYGCGGGSYTSAGGIGNTWDLAACNLQGVFSMLFGSYFGDWDSQNNFLRAPLAQGKILTDVWSGRPHWQFHHMALGENIGYSVRLSQNNNGLYFASYGARFIHLALMGDPSLRNDVLAPPTNLTATFNGPSCVISWTLSADTADGYYVYRKTPSANEFTRITPTAITANNYTDSCLVTAGQYSYMVKAIKLTQTPSGSYYNLSQGISDTAMHLNTFFVNAGAIYSVANNVVSFVNTSVHASSWMWDFGDGSTSTLQNPQHLFQPGNYTVSLIATNGCDDDTAFFTISGLHWNSLGGNLTYANTQNSPMGGTIMQLTDTNNAVVAITFTAMDGTYLFEDVPDGIYNVVPVAGLSPGSINSTDALTALKHFVHLVTLTNLLFEAGDVDNNNIITSVDALMISRRFTGQLATFPAGDWYFEHPQVSLSGYTSFAQNLKGICYGDCNASFVP